MSDQKIKIIEEDLLVRIYLSEKEKQNGKPLYEIIVQKARELNLAGATVTRGIMGFGADRRMHNSKILELSENLPIIIELADKEENINLLLPFLDEVVQKGFVTIEKAHVLKYRINRNS